MTPNSVPCPMDETRAKAMSGRVAQTRSLAPYQTSLGSIALVAAALLIGNGCFGSRTPFVPTPGEGPLNSVHAQNVNKFVFSTRPIDRDHPDPAALSTSFNSKDRVYGRFYLPGPIANQYVSLETRAPDGAGEVVGALLSGPDDDFKQAACGYEVQLLVDGKRTKDWVLARSFDEKQASRSTHSVPLNPDPDLDPESRRASLEASENWNQLIRKLPPGHHVFRFQLRTNCGAMKAQSLAAVGEFGLDVGDR